MQKAMFLNSIGNIWSIVYNFRTNINKFRQKLKDNILSFCPESISYAIDEIWQLHARAISQLISTYKSFN